MEEEKKVHKVTEPKNTAFSEPTTVEVEHTIDDEVKYLKNVGEPKLKTIDSALKNSWTTIDGVKYNVMVIWPINRNNDLPWEEKNDSQEAKLAKQLQLKASEKAYVYFDPNYGTGVPEKGWSKILYIKQGVAINHSFTVQDYPHIIDHPVGLGGTSGERLYTAKVGQTVKVSHQGDFKKLWTTFGYLDEVNEKGETIKENVYSSKRANPDKPVDTSRYNPNVATEVDHRDLPSEHKKNLSRLGEQTLDIKEARTKEELE